MSTGLRQEFLGIVQALGGLEGWGPSEAESRRPVCDTSCLHPTIGGDMDEDHRPVRRVRVEQGIYLQPNGKYTVCFMAGGRPLR